MNEHSDLERRLRALGDEAVEPTLASQHLTAMAAAVPVRKAPRLHRAKVAAAFCAGLLLGGTSLASAGVLGEAPKNAVADVAAKVGVNLPGGKVERSTEGCGGVEYKNHGQFVKAGGDPKSPCGKPVKSVDKVEDGSESESTGETKAPKVKDDKTKPAGTPGAKAGTGDGCGPPPWAHGNKAAKTPEAIAAREAACPDDDEDETEVEDETEGEQKDKDKDAREEERDVEEEDAPEVTTTTVTTEAPPETTTTSTVL